MSKKIKKIIDFELKNIKKEYQNTDIDCQNNINPDFCPLNRLIKKNIYNQLGYCQFCVKNCKF
jgi:hypothetical protein